MLYFCAAAFSVARRVNSHVYVRTRKHLTEECASKGCKTSSSIIGDIVSGIISGVNVNKQEQINGNCAAAATAAVYATATAAVDSASAATTAAVGAAATAVDATDDYITSSTARSLFV